MAREPNSSRFGTLTRTAKSPPAMRASALSTLRTGRISDHDKIAPSASAASKLNPEITATTPVRRRRFLAKESVSARKTACEVAIRSLSSASSTCDCVCSLAMCAWIARWMSPASNSFVTPSLSLR